MIKDLSGKIFGKLTVLSIAGKNEYHQTTFNCMCSCGKEKIAVGIYLTAGRTKSCGCNSKTGQAIVHGLRNTNEYIVWANMKQRCYNKNDKDYKYYGARGIIVCDRWLNSFENFYQDMGMKPSNNHSIDRIDNNGNYTPENCRWATSLEQSNNKRLYGSVK